MDVRGWLETLGLGQYADAFDVNHIDGRLLRDLTGDDLRELGVSSLGHRKRLLDAIAALRGGAAAAAPDAERAQLSERGSAAKRLGFTSLVDAMLAATRGSGD